MVDTEEPHTAWVIGAGFSRSLNAPLFKELFRSRHQVTAAYAMQGVSIPTTLIETLALYRKHASTDVGGEGHSSGTFWRDAEEFLDTLESAKGGVGAHESLLRSEGVFARLTIDDLVVNARRALAIECSRFLRGARLSMERWNPYTQWARSLNQNHTVITFNYDHIPDLLSGDPDHSIGPPRLRTLVPAGDVLKNWDLLRLEHGGSAPVLKLHGSVDWFRNVDGTIRQEAQVSNVFDEVPILGVPGPAKAALLGEYKPIAVLWALARKALAAATRVIFVGYRFPPTDASARLQLLNSMINARSLRYIDLVLGPDANHPDVRRMECLLQAVLPLAKIRVLPLYAEDFLPYFHLPLVPVR